MTADIKQTLYQAIDQLPEKKLEQILEFVKLIRTSDERVEDEILTQRIKDELEGDYLTVREAREYLQDLRDVEDSH
jgi:hypothetical protein